MRNTPYRHSVWIDVFGVVLFGAVLLGGAGYLLYEAENVATGFATDVSRAVPSGVRGPASPPPRRTSGRPDLRSSSSPLLSGRSGRAPSGGEVPFSKSWRSQATPSLGSPSSSGGEGQGGSGGSASSRSSPAIASARPSGRRNRYGAGTGASRGSAGSQWRAEARRLSGRVQALSNELGQMARESSRARGRDASQRSSSGTASAASASSSDRDVPNPPSVPIDEHSSWLAIAGLLWGVWRLWG